MEANREAAELLKQVALRTMHESFESLYTPHVRTVAVNVWGTSVDRATGNDQLTCVLSVMAARDAFLAVNLARVDVDGSPNPHFDAGPFALTLHDVRAVSG